jgi:hypothetical protein
MNQLSRTAATTRSGTTEPSWPPGYTTSPDREEPPGGTPGTSGPYSFAFARNASHKPIAFSGQGMPPNPPPIPDFNAPPMANRQGAKASFGPGFEIMSEDEVRKGKEGIGAWEVFARYNYMDIGSEIFTGGIASPNGNANRLFMTDVGFNWYLTQWTKFVFDSNYTAFNKPVTYNTGRTQSNSNLFLARLEIYF